MLQKFPTSNEDTVMYCHVNTCTGEPNQDFVYFVNEKEKVVVCKKSGCANDVVKYVVDAMGMLNFTKDMSMHPDKLQLSDSYTGKAKCHADDAFDLEKGMQLARQRMLYNYNKAYFKQFRKVLNKVRFTVLPELKRKTDQIQDKIEELEVKLDKFCY